jgi:8-oxo-dGTP diphosphatase
MEIVRAAGGVVWREEAGRLALVHRPRHDDWSLPKGKLDPEESWHDAALREVAEETGCDARIARFAGAKLFLSRPTPKLVLYWHMRVVRDGDLEHEDEVDEVAWLSPRNALARLDHASDRQLLLRALTGGTWRRSSGGPARGRVPGFDREAFRKLLVVDSRPAAVEELSPYLRLVEKAVEREERRGVRRADAVFR